MTRAQPAASLPKLCRFNQFCGIDTEDVKNPFGRKFKRCGSSKCSSDCDMETLWQNVVTEQYGARFKIAFEKACRYETPTTKAEVGELIDFTFAELGRRVGRAGFAARHRLGGGCDISEWCREIQRDKCGGVKPWPWPNVAVRKQLTGVNLHC